MREVEFLKGLEELEDLTAVTHLEEADDMTCWLVVRVRQASRDVVWSILPLLPSPPRLPDLSHPSLHSPPSWLTC
jgi:hypothetical protein